MIVAATAIYIADKIVSQFIKEEGYGRFRRFLFPHKKYKSLLCQLILDTVSEFEKDDKIEELSDKFPFYHSQLLFEILNNHILFSKNDSGLIAEAFKENPNILVPTQQQLETFYQIFIGKTKESEKLKELYFHENYKGEIFKISNALQTLVAINEEILKKVTTSESEGEERYKNIMAKINIIGAADLSNQIEAITSLRHTNKHYAVIELLETYKKTKWNGLDDELKWKIQVNLGQTYFDLDDYKEACTYFIDLLNYNYKRKESTAIASLGYAINGDKINANKLAKEAISLDSSLINAYLALMVITDAQNVDEIYALIPVSMRENPAIAYSIGGKFLVLEKYEEAIKIFEKLINSLTEENLFKIEVLNLLATTRYKNLNITDSKNFISLDESVINTLNLILDNYKQIWDYYKNTDLRKNNWNVLTNMGIVNKILGKIDISEANFNESLEINKNYFTYYNLLLLKIENKTITQRIILEIEKLTLTLDEICQFVILKADLLQDENKNEEAIKLLVDNAVNIKGSIHETIYYAVLIDLLLKASDLANARTYILEQLNQYPNHFVPNLLLSKLQLQEGKKDIDSQLTKTKNLLSKSDPIGYYVKLVDLFAQLQDYKSASETLEIIADVDKYNPITKNLLICYFQGGNYKKALPLAEKLFQINKNESFLADYLSVIYEKTEDFDGAIQIINDYLQEIPNDSFFKTKLSIIYFKKGEFAIGTKILNTISEISKLSTDIQFFIANAYIKNGEYEKGLEIAYKLRQENYSNPKFHEKYIMLNTELTNLDNDVHFPSIVTNNTYVVLNDGKRKIEYVLVDDPHYPQEISINETTGRILLDKHLLDTVKIGNNDYKIDSIMSKYTYAFHDSMAQISTRFSDSSLSVKILNMEGDNGEFDPKQLFNEIDKAEKFSKEVDELYEKRIATIGSNATLTHENPIRYWGKITSSTDIGLYSMGPKEEYYVSKQLLRQETDIIIDIVSLLTLFHLDSLHLLSTIPNKTFVTKTTVKNIEDQIASIESSLDNETMTVLKVGNEYLRNTITVEQKKIHISNLKSFLALINKYCIVANALLSSNYSEKKKVDEVLGESFNDTVLLAQQNGAILFSDDVNFRAISQSKYSVPGVSTFIFLQYLFEIEIIKTEEYNKYIGLMIKLNYRLIPVTPEILYELYDFAKFKIEQPFINGCDVIRPDILNDLTAAVLCVEFLYKVYQTTTINRTFICQFILRKYFDGRGYLSSKNIIISCLNRRFHLLPIQKAEILSFIF